MSKINYIARIWSRIQLYDKDMNVLSCYNNTTIQQGFCSYPIKLSRYKIKLIKIHSC